MMTSYLLALLAAASFASVEVKWEDAILRLDGSGRVVALQNNRSGRNYALAGRPFCRIETDNRNLVPTGVSRAGDRITFSFPDNVKLTYEVSTAGGFSLWEVAELEGLDPSKVRVLHLCSLQLDELPKVGHRLNACRSEDFSAALIAARINVRGFPVAGAQRGSNLNGVTHTFSPSLEEIREGRLAGRFAATSSRDQGDGWSMRGRGFGPPLDLTGLEAIKVWLHGDGKGERLKIQLFDGKGGYRDDYVIVDFEGWREVVCDRPAQDKSDHAHITRLNFYYNGLPAKTSVACTLDAVRAVIDAPDGPREIMLEDFEDSAGELWDLRGVVLNAESWRQFGIMPAAFGILACPRDRFEATIDAFEKAAGLPNPHPGGVWSKQSPWTKQSYLFITRVAEKDADEVIAWAKRGGFSTILILGGSWSQSHGHHEINRDMFPDGLPSLQRTVARFRQAGFRVGLHFLAAAVYLNDPYVWPVPDPRLFKDSWAELAADVDAKVEFIPTAGPPEGFPAEDGGYRGNGTFIQVGDELIHYQRLQTKPPYGFGGCQRAAAKTGAAPHRKGDRAAHVQRSYGYFLYDLDSTLADEVIGNVCRVANAINADMLYFDGSERLQGEHWYYNAKLHKMYYDRLDNKDTFLQGSSYSHFSWHINSRTASADGHGDLKGYLDQRMAWFDGFAADLMPLDIGWYYVYDPAVTADQFEYVLGKCLGFDASISVQTSPANLREHPEMGPIFDLVRTYDRLRLSGKVPQSLRKLLREPGREYRLLTDPLRLRRIVFEPWREVKKLDGKQNVWTVAPAMEGSVLGAQIRCLPTAGKDQKGAATLPTGLVKPALRIGDHRIVFPVTLAPGDRLAWFPGRPPEVIPARQGPRRSLPEVAAVDLKEEVNVTFSLTGSPMPAAQVRIVQDCPEEHELPDPGE